MKVIEVTADNVSEHGLFCIKNKKAPGYNEKMSWFKAKVNQGIKLKIAVDKAGKQHAFIEYLPSELAWRPVHAHNFMFIQCIMVFSKDQREKGLASLLIKHCEEEARKNGMSGICTMTSKGTWMADKSLFEKNNFEIVDQNGRFELMTKRFDDKAEMPKFNDWEKQQIKYKGWNLVYADQCPWHEKSVSDLLKSAKAHGIDLKITKLEKPEDAQNAPSGFGTFALIKDGKLIEDHYLSRTRFENILKQEGK